jgi:RHS repeat-associated protein
METPQSTTEEAIYSGVNTTRNDLPAGYPTDTYTNPNNKVAKVNGSGNKIGPAQVLKVMAGDKFNIRVSSWYKTYGATPGTPVNPLTDLLNALTNNIGSITSTHGGVTGTELSNSGVLSPGATTFLNNQPNNTGKPKAYINWILFDEQFKYVSSSSGAEQIGANEEFKVHLFNDKPIDKSGYLYVYVSNETPNIDVFFDNLQVTHIRGPLLETNEYYPFGLLQAGISYKTLKGGYAENKKKYNGKELQSKEFSDGSGLELYDYGWRMQDPQIGRWHVIDPAIEDEHFNYTPYAYVYNNPVRLIDPDGRDSLPSGRMIWDKGAYEEMEQMVAENPNATWNPSFAEKMYILGSNIGLFTLGSSLNAATKATNTTEQAAKAVSLEQRANEIQKTLPAFTQTKTTTAVASATTAEGKNVTLVASSEKNLRPAQRAALQPGEVAVSGKGHAEATIVNHANANGMKVTNVAASRPICQGCAAAISNAGAQAGSKLKVVNQNFVQQVQF